MRDFVFWAIVVLAFAGFIGFLPWALSKLFEAGLFAAESGIRFADIMAAVGVVASGIAAVYIIVSLAEALIGEGTKILMKYKIKNLFINSYKFDRPWTRKDWHYLGK